MSSKFTVSEDWMRKNVLANPTVTAALNAKARRLAPIVKRIALKESDQRYAASVRIIQGQRPARSPKPHPTPLRARDGRRRTGCGKGVWRRKPA